MRFVKGRDVKLSFAIYTLSPLKIDDAATRFFRIQEVEGAADLEEADDDFLAEVVPFRKANGKCGKTRPSKTGPERKISPENESPEDKSPEGDAGAYNVHDNNPSHLYWCLPKEVGNGRKLFCPSLHIAEITEYEQGLFTMWRMPEKTMDSLLADAKKEGITIGAAVEGSGRYRRASIIADTSLHALVQKKPSLKEKYDLQWGWLDWTRGLPHYYTTIELPLHLPMKNFCGIDQTQRVKEISQLAALLGSNNGGTTSVDMRPRLNTAEAIRCFENANSVLEAHIDYSGN